LEAILGRVGLIRSHHLDEAKASGLLCVGISHNLAFLHLAVLLKEASNLGFGQARVNASDEQVGTGVDSAVAIILGAAVVLEVTVQGHTLAVKSKQYCCVEGARWREGLEQ
jgi:hypothetical protein